ncbi:MAG: FadR family transcriptional regulator [Anaerolineae bacterium]|nr:FadR family transcriptional regulator [Anaerolineae bacterium]
MINDQIQEAIKQYILDNHLQAGDKLPSENSLSQQLGVSRNSVRESVQSLASLGIIEVRRGSGLYVKGFSLQPIIKNLSYGVLFDLSELEDLLQVREVLENGMVHVALPYLAEDRLRTLDDIVAWMRLLAERGEPLVEPDRQFHLELFRPVGNHILLQLQDIFWGTLRNALQHVNIADSNPLRTAQLHGAVVDAARSGDAEQVRRALSRHYEDIKDRLRRMKAARTPIGEEG